MLRKASRFASLLLGCTVFFHAPAFAVNRDMIQLQTQVQQLQDAVARLQQSNDERMGVLKDLVQQSADQTNKIAGIVDALQRQMTSQQEAGGGKIDQVSGQVQALNDSLDEIKARLGRLEKALSDMRNQQQTITPPAASAPGDSAAPATPNAAPGSTLPPAASTGTPAPDGFSRDVAVAPGGRRAKPSAGTPLDNSTSNTPPATAAPAPAPAPVDQMYRTALGDYMSAKYGLAQSEFADLARAYPDNPLAGNASFYQGEIDYRGARYGAAVQEYDRVLEQYPESNKVPSAHLHKAQALVQLKQNEAAIREFRSLIQRFPNSPEALAARTRLASLGAPTKPRS